MCAYLFIEGLYLLQPLNEVKVDNVVYDDEESVGCSIFIQIWGVKGEFVNVESAGSLFAYCFLSILKIQTQM